MQKGGRVSTGFVFSCVCKEKRYFAMDLSPFKQDIDELISDFEEGDFKLLSDMRRVWLARKFSYIFDAKPGSSQLALFMQSLYAHCVGHMVATYSLSHRLGGLYCLYCFYEIQPFKPPFKIYLSLGELRRLKALVIDAKKDGIRVVSTLIRRMLEKHAFLFGFVDMNDYSEAGMLKISKHKAMLQKMHEKLFPDDSIAEYLLLDMGKDLELDTLQKVITGYDEAKALVLREASMLVDVQNIKHIAENVSSIRDDVGKIVENWNLQKDVLGKQTRSEKKVRKHPCGDDDYGQVGSVQQQAHEGYWEDENLPPKGFMHLLTAEEEEQDVSQDIQVEEIEQLLESEDDREEQSNYDDNL